MMRLCKCLLLLPILLQVSCATIINGSKQNVIFVSEPRSARIKVDGEYIGITPFKANLPRSANHKVSIELEGYQPYEITLKHQLNGWIFGNLIIGGLAGIIVDAATGSMYTLKPNDIYTELTPKAVTQAMSNQIQISVTLQPQPDWIKIGQLQPTLNNR